MTKNILVTGGAGFIGSHTVDVLVSKVFNVTVLDNLSTGFKKNVNKKAKFIHDDIHNMHKYKIDADGVMHCAAQISVSASLKNPAEDANINIIGSLKVLGLCKKLGIKKFVFSSTGGAMYGNLTKSILPATEKQSEKPESHYAIAKRAVEMYMEFYGKTYGLECISLRYANVYGPRQDCLGEAGVIAIFINRLLRNKKPVIYGDGLQTRDFVYVSDVADANVKAIASNVSSKYINIGTQTQLSINSLLKKLEILMNKKTKPFYKPTRKGEIKYNSLHVGLANRTLNWKPRINLEKGLKLTIDWFKG